MGRTYYFVEMEKLNFPAEGFHTSQQQALLNTLGNADPVTVLRIKEKNFYKGWHRLEGLHERLDKTPRRMNGDPNYLHESIVGGDTPFTAYLNEDNDRLLFKTSKSNVFGLQKRLYNEFPQIFIPKKNTVNFLHLLKSLKQATVVSSWFNEINGKVKAVGLFGDRVNLDDAFERYSNLGKLSAISLELEDKSSGKPFEVMITKFFGVILYSNWEVKQDLDFLIELQELLFHPKSLTS